MAKKAALQAGELDWHQARFVEKYVSTGNATVSYIYAGYSRNGAKQSAYNLLKRPHIIQAVEQEREKLQTILNFKREDQIAILHAIATAKLDDFAGVKLHDKESFKKLGYLTHAIESAEPTRGGGVKIKLRDNKAALSELSEILGFAKSSDDKAPTDNVATRLLKRFGGNGK